MGSALTLHRSPQLERSAINHLCSTCRISTVFADARNYDTAKNLKEGVLAINISHVLFNLKVDPQPKALDVHAKPSDIAYLFHSSGTSSGLPKPIPQTHYAAVGALPRLPGGETHATFSTTPLYHGGIADCLRAWTSGATIHLFPGTQPITAANVHRAVRRANAHLHGACQVKYFTCVPYILQMLVNTTTDSSNSDNAPASPASPSSSSPPSLSGFLQEMELVGVGGAALPPTVGEALVSHGVRLVSRFGSAECGFLLSSHRNYDQDHEWLYLRADPSLQPDYYDFEPQPPPPPPPPPRHDDGQGGGDSHSGPPAPAALFELVVKPQWPHRGGEPNRADGSFATADLFEQHPTIPHAWRYHSRADAQITLLNGKKFDPAPVEGELLASVVGKRVLQDAMIFGTGRESPGLLLVPRGRTADYVSDEQLIEDVWPTIEKMNSGTQSHARVGRGEIVVVSSKDGHAAALPKTNKGTILRGQAEKMFAVEIEGAYSDKRTTADRPPVEIPDSLVMEELTTLFDDVLGRHVSATVDLFAQGVDSMACSHLRKRISQTFFPGSDTPLPLNIIYDHGTIERLSSYILRCRVSGGGVAVEDDEAAQHQLMLDLVEKYRHAIHSPTGSFNHQEERVVVLTGSTGFLGAHILDLLLQDPKVKKVFCLVRAETPRDAEDRIIRSLQSRELGSSTDDDVVRQQQQQQQQQNFQRLVCLPCSLSAANLGLSEADWRQVADEATMIIHAAWSVNFSLGLGSFEDQLAGLCTLLALRDATRGSAARFVFISSTAAVAAGGVDDRLITEALSPEPEDASPLGYARSKWVAENICSSARVGPGSAPGPLSTATAVGPPLSAEEKFPIIITRVGQLCGNEQHGVWNMAEAYPIMLSTTRLTGCLPDLAEEPLSWLPANVAARAVLDCCFMASPLRQSGRPSKHQKNPVYHIANPHQEPTWSDMLKWIAPSHVVVAVGSQENETGGGQSPGLGQGIIRIVPRGAWVRSLEGALADHDDHPARSLLHLWKQMFDQGREHDHPQPVFDTTRAEGASETMRNVQPLGEEDVLRMWKWIQANI